MKTLRRPRVGLALGSGSARGWAHVGVIRALEQAGIRPDLVCGTSVGALVGAAYAAGELDRFEQWVLGMGVTDVVGFMDVSLSGGLIKGERLMEFFRRNFVDRPVEELTMPFAAVATALQTGAEVWLREGSTRRGGARLHRPARHVHAGAARGSAARGRRARQSGAGIAGARDGRGDCDRSRPQLRHPGPSPARRTLNPKRPSARSANGYASCRTTWARSSLRMRRRAPAAVHARRGGLQHQHHAGADHAQPHGGRAARRDRGAAAGSLRPARLSPGRKRSTKAGARWKHVSPVSAR